MDVGTLIARLGLDTEPFEKALDGATTEAEASGSKTALAFKSAFAAGIAGVGVVLASGLAAAWNAASDNTDAINNLRAQLGLTKEEATALSAEAQQLWVNGFGGSITEASARIASVRQNIKGLADEELAAVAAGNSAIADMMGEDAAKVDNSIAALMNNMGMSYQEAQNFIAAGAQRGLNASGDFLDSIGEYSVQFGEAGFSGSEFFSIIESGMQQGMLGTDKTADALKEFRIRIMERSDETVNALLSMGIASDEMLEGLETGQLSVADAFAMVQSGLQGMDNQIYQNTYGVALFGTQWEDLGANAILSIDTQKTALTDLEGTTAGLNAQYENLGAVGEGLWRRILVALIPVGDGMLLLANATVPTLMAAIGTLETGIASVIGWFQAGGASSGELGVALTALQDVWAGLQTFLNTIIPPLQTMVSGVFKFIGDFIRANGTETSSFLRTNWAVIGDIFRMAMELMNATIIPAFQAVASFISAHGGEIHAVLNNSWTAIQALITAVLAIIQGVLKTALAVIRGDWQGAWDAIKEMTNTVWTSIRTIVSAAADNLRIALGVAWEAIKGAAGSAWEAIKTAITTPFAGVKAAIDGTLLGIKTAVSSAWSDIEGSSARAWATIGRAIGNAFAGAVRYIRDTINDIIENLNNAIDAFNTLPGPDAPKIPMLASGTTFFAGGQAIVGELGPELVTLPTGARVDDTRTTQSMLGGGTTINVNANYAYQPERSLRDDLELFQMTYA